MRLVITLSMLAIVGTAASSIGVAFWTGHFSLQGQTMRAIHYDTQYDLSSQRRHSAR